jgi:hypothetical protein
MCSSNNGAICTPTTATRCKTYSAACSRLMYREISVTVAPPGAAAADSMCKSTYSASNAARSDMKHSALQCCRTRRNQLKSGLRLCRREHDAASGCQVFSVHYCCRRHRHHLLRRRRRRTSWATKRPIPFGSWLMRRRACLNTRN